MSLMKFTEVSALGHELQSCCRGLKVIAKFKIRKVIYMAS